jgi:hypothetical protein
MKNLIKRLSKMNNVKLIIGLVVASVLLSSCVRYKKPIEDFKGGIIYTKHTYKNPKEYSFDVKVKSKFFKVFVYKLDHDKYKVGDTIK